MNPQRHGAWKVLFVERSVACASGPLLTLQTEFVGANRVERLHDFVISQGPR